MPSINDQDTLAERLRRRPAKPMGSPRVGSNPTGVVSINTASVAARDHVCSRAPFCAAVCCVALCWFRLRWRRPRACVRARVRAVVRAYVRACVRACVHACACLHSSRAREAQGARAGVLLAVGSDIARVRIKPAICHWGCRDPCQNGLRVYAGGVPAAEVQL